jgi:large subunit ribosomal protein L21
LILLDVEAGMYAVIQTGGKQYRVAPGDMVKVEKLEGEKGDPVTFDKVLLTSDGEDIHLGNPYLEGARVLGRITGHGKNRKIIVFKYKRRKGYRKKQGHRQNFTLIQVDNIESK